MLIVKLRLRDTEMDWLTLRLPDGVRGSVNVAVSSLDNVPETSSDSVPLRSLEPVAVRS